jgi:NTE family protein
MVTIRKTPHAGARPQTPPQSGLPGQVVLVLQGGGALGADQVGVYEAMHEAGIDPDWVIGTSIGAINAALIAGNPPAQRLERLI